MTRASIFAAALLLAAASAAASPSQHCAGNAAWDVQYGALRNPGARTTAVAWFRAQGCRVRVGDGAVTVECPPTVSCEGRHTAPSRQADAAPPPATRTTVTTTETAQAGPGLDPRLDQLRRQLAEWDLWRRGLYPPSVPPYVGEDQCGCSAGELMVGQTVTCTARYSGARAVQWDVSGAGRVVTNPAPDQAGPATGYDQATILATRPGYMAVFWSQGRLCREVTALAPPQPWYKNPEAWLAVGAIAGGVVWGARRGRDPADVVPPPGF